MEYRRADIDGAVKQVDALARLTDHILQQQNLAGDEAVLSLLRKRFRDEALHVRVEKPRWMPERLYRALMRTIVLEVK